MMSAPGNVVWVHLAGGLGNQLFQYAFGRQLAAHNEARLILDASYFPTDVEPDYSSGVRAVELGNFSITGVIVNDRIEKASTAAPAARGVVVRKIKKWRRRLQAIPDRLRPYYRRRELVEPEGLHFRFDPRLRDLRFSGTIFVHGFWQTEKYFKNIEDLIRRELTVSQESTGKNAELAAIASSPMSAAVHIRHGDNANSIARALGVLPRDYYELAINLLSKEVGALQLLVFSDDLDWARAILPSAPRTTFVEHNRGSRSYEDLRLMSMCQHHIIANSTFGWWGAWLGKKEGQIVYAPRRYYQNVDRPNPDLYPADWRLL